MFYKLTTALLIGLFLSGCAAMHKDWQANTCNYDGSYAEGVNDAKNNNNMNPSRLTSQCPDNTRAEVQKGYREGYTSQTNSVTGLVNKVGELFGKSTKSCKARNNDVHSNFCADFSQGECQTHSGVCSWK